ncbi:hypothetical protein A5697_20275 [Mycobacterium sp. E3251]|nr:hypothetical protein A5697_20275 [Mycobacterium sp. E3251]
MAAMLLESPLLLDAVDAVALVKGGVAASAEVDGAMPTGIVWAFRPHAVPLLERGTSFVSRQADGAAQCASLAVIRCLSVWRLASAEERVEITFDLALVNIAVSSGELARVGDRHERLKLRF